MLTRLLVAVVFLALLAVAALWVLGQGLLVEPWGEGTPAAEPIPAAVVAARAATQRGAAESLGVVQPHQILFGDLHVHTTYSTDAFLMALPMMGGDGAHPVADACDFARYCAALDFWSINDHAITLTPERWEQTVEEMRQCDAVSGDVARPDVVPFLGWEWTQIGTHPANHYGHKNVVLRDLGDEGIPARPIAAGPPPGAPPVLGSGASTFGLGLAALLQRREGGMELARYLQDMAAAPICPGGVPVRELPTDCRERASTPGELFAKLDDWGHEALVIPHGTTRLCLGECYNPSSRRRPITRIEVVRIRPQTSAAKDVADLVEDPCSRATETGTAASRPSKIRTSPWPGATPSTTYAPSRPRAWP